MTEDAPFAIESWTAPVVKFDAVRLTHENIEEVARWVGADFTEVVTNLKSRRCEVAFTIASELDTSKRGNRILYAVVGQYVVRQNAHVDVYGQVVPDRYYALDEGEMWTFKKEDSRA